MVDLETTTHREVLRIFRNGNHRRLRDGLLGFLGSIGISAIYYVNGLGNSTFNVNDDIPYLGAFIAITTILATTGAFDYLIRRFTNLGDRNLYS